MFGPGEADGGIQGPGQGSDSSPKPPNLESSWEGQAGPAAP